MPVSRNAFTTHEASTWGRNEDFPSAVGEIARRKQRMEFSTLGLPPPHANSSNVKSLKLDKPLTPMVYECRQSDPFNGCVRQAN